MVLSTDAKIVKSVVIRSILSFFNSNNFALTEKDMCFCIYLCSKKNSKMDIIGTLVTVLSAMGGWEALKWFLNRKSNSRVAEAEADSAEFHVMKETYEFLQGQLKQKEERFAEQTQLVRKLNSEVLELTQQKAAVELELQKFRCIRQKCSSREPQNGY